MPAATATAAVKSTTAAAARAAETGASARGITAGLAAMVIAAETAGARAGLAAGLIESPRCLSISVERRVPSAGGIVDSAVSAGDVTPTAAHVIGDAALASPSVVIVAVVKCIAARVVAVVIIDGVMVVQIEPPASPAPAVPAEET